MSRTTASLTAPLAPGDIVDVVAPGFRCPPENLAAGVEFLRRQGLVPRVPPDLFGDDLLCSNSDAKRFAQLRRALTARDSRAVWCVRGGYGAIRIIERLRALTPPRQPKLFIGYSDATTVHWLLNQHWKWPSLHGPLLDRLGTTTVPEAEREELYGVLFGNLTEVTFHDLEPLNAAARRRRVIEGPVCGGNLTVLQSLLGTPLQRRPRGLLFLEDVGERGYRIDRMLEQLLQAGVLRNLSALVLGAFTGGREADGGNLGPQTLERFAHGQSIPVLRGMQAGHGEYQRPVFLHTPARLTCGPSASLSISTPRFARTPGRKAGRT